MKPISGPAQILNNIILEAGTPSITNGNGVTRIGTSGIIRPHPPHGPARSDGRRETGTNMIMMDGNGNTEL